MKTKKNKIDYSYITPCIGNNANVEPGLTCHFSSNKSDTTLTHCAATNLWWCQSDFQASCVMSQDGTRTSTNDGTLCQNKTFWEKIDPDWWYLGGVKYGSGVRCNGSIMHIIYPWYKYHDGEPLLALKHNCEDKSDQVFVSGEPCYNRSIYINLHNKEWCSDSRVKNETICTGPTSWLEDLMRDQARLDDPHFCQSSCAKPGLNCAACTNEKYFNCSRSGTCLHPDLKCDGHPQCPDNEDEDYEMCAACG